MKKQLKEKVLSAIEKDFSRRYIATGKIQADGRLELNKFCINLLQLKDRDILYVINDHSSVILVKSPLKHDAPNIISKAIWDAKRKRLRLNPDATRLLMTCEIGFQVFNYNQDIAIQIEPYIRPPSNLLNKKINYIEDLAPFILRSSRSTVHVDILSETQLINEKLSFRLIGEYWISKIYTDPLDNKKYYNDDLKDNSTIYSCYKVTWFPVIIYEDNNYSRPGLLSFNEKTLHICSSLIEECNSWSLNIDAKMQFFKNGKFDFNGENLYKINYNDNNIELININKDHPKYKKISLDEKGLMKLALPELINCVKNYEKNRS